MKILLTSTSFQDTPGKHHHLLNSLNFDITNLRGPVKEEVLLPIIGDFDGIICGDDEITEAVIKVGVEGKLRIISKYGIGLDKVDLVAAKKFNVPVTNCPGVNQITVAEHVFSLLLSFVKNIIPENQIVREQRWERLIGNDIYGKTLGILGLGNVGKEVAIRAKAFGMRVLAFDKFINKDFTTIHGIEVCDSQMGIFRESDVISLNLSLDESSRHLINQSNLHLLKKDVIIINTARAGLIQQDAIIDGVKSGQIKGYLTDVLDEEPMIKDHPFLQYSNIIITPHIGSRTYENVERQGTMAVENLIANLKS